MQTILKLEMLKMPLSLGSQVHFDQVHFIKVIFISHFKFIFIKVIFISLFTPVFEDLLLISNINGVTKGISSGHSLTKVCLVLA